MADAGVHAPGCSTHAQSCAAVPGPETMPTDDRLWRPFAVLLALRSEIDLAGLGFWVDAMKEQGESVPTQDLKAMTNDSFLPQDLRRTS